MAKETERMCRSEAVPFLTQITKINRDGGPGYRLTGVQNSLFVDQEDLNKFRRLRVAVATQYGLIATRYSLEPKMFSGQGHNIIKGKDENFPSLFDFIRHHTYSKVARLSDWNALKLQFEVDTKIIPFRFWKDEAILALIPAGQENPLLSAPTCIRTYITPALKESFERRYGNSPDDFKRNLRELTDQFRDLGRLERDIYTLDYSLRKFGINAAEHLRVGIDSPGSFIEFRAAKNAKKIHVPFELKTHSRKFFADAKTLRGKDKYWEWTPLSVLCARNNYPEWRVDAGIGIIAVEDLIRHCSKISGMRVRLPNAA